MDEMQREVYKALGTGQDKYTYFLLAAAGAAIGFAVTQTQTAALARSQVPLAVAVLCWGLSFAAGCMRVQYVNSTLYANMSLLKVQAGQMQSVGTHPGMMQAAADGIRGAIETNSRRGAVYGQWQFYLLIAGAVAFLAWHIIEMARRAGL